MKTLYRNKIVKNIKKCVISLPIALLLISNPDVSIASGYTSDANRLSITLKEQMGNRWEQEVRTENAYYTQHNVNYNSGYWVYVPVNAGSNVRYDSGAIAKTTNARADIYPIYFD